MMRGRIIRLARTGDGQRLTFLSIQVTDGKGHHSHAQVANIFEFGRMAELLWGKWAARLPEQLSRLLVAEVGKVKDGARVRRYEIAHVGGRILPNQEDGLLFGAATAFADIPTDVAVVFGPSAVLALAQFALDGVQSPKEDLWPFGDGLEVFDTMTSPYPPQDSTESHDDIRIQPGSTLLESLYGDIVFPFGSRIECWQRPFDVLYNVRRRNLRVMHRGSEIQITEPQLILDTLSAEVEPSLGHASFIARATLRDGTNVLSPCRAPLIVECHVTDTLKAILGPVSPVTAACVCDPIEGDIYGYAPSLALAQGAPMTICEVAE